MSKNKYKKQPPTQDSDFSRKEIKTRQRELRDHTLFNVPRKGNWTDKDVPYTLLYNIDNNSAISKEAKDAIFKEAYGRDRTDLDRKAQYTRAKSNYSPYSHRAGFSSYFDNELLPENSQTSTRWDPKFINAQKKLWQVGEKAQYESRKQRSQYPGEGLPQYSLGGWIGENKEGLIGYGKMVGGAAMMATGVGAGVGASMIASGAGDIYGEFTDGNQGADAALAKNDQIMANQSGAVQSNLTQNTFAQGGIMPGNMPNANLEKEEVTVGPDGSMAKMDLPSHTQGGGDVPLEEGTIIYSDRYKPQGSKLTYAEEADVIRKQIKKLEKKLYA